MGEHKLGLVDNVLRRAATGWGGGVGSSYQELCGALSGGVMLIGVLYGRDDRSQNPGHCKQLTVQYLEQFGAVFGPTRCKDLREAGYGDDVPCPVLVERAVSILLEVLEAGG